MAVGSQGAHPPFDRSCFWSCWVTCHPPHHQCRASRGAGLDAGHPSVRQIELGYTVTGSGRAFARSGISLKNGAGFGIWLLLGNGTHWNWKRDAGCKISVWKESGMQDCSKKGTGTQEDSGIGPVWKIELNRKKILKNQQLHILDPSSQDSATTSFLITMRSHVMWRHNDRYFGGLLYCQSLDQKYRLKPHFYKLSKQPRLN